MKDLTVENARVQRTKDGSVSGNCYGIIAGYAGYYGNVEFINVTVKDSEIIGFGKVGALVGMIETQGKYAHFTDCKVENTKIHSGYNAGGLAGLIHSQIGGSKNTVIITNCSVDVEFDSKGIGEIVELEGYEGKYSLYAGEWLYADTAVYYNEYNAPTLPDNMDAIVHNTPYNLIPES